jgi:beta-N-acetylhexosaminidase
MSSLPWFLRQYANIIFLLPMLFSSADAAGAPEDTTIELLLRTMTMEEKAGQMILVYHSDYEFLRSHKVGGVLIMQNMLEKPSALRTQLRHAQENLPIPLFVAIDQEGGSVNRLSPLIGWKKTPSAQKLSAWDPDSIQAYSRQVGAKLKQLGINMNLAPVADPAVNHEGIETYMGRKNRSFGKDAEHIIPAARAFIKGFSDQDVLCVIKHFPGYDVPANSDLEAAFSNADSQTIAGYAGVFSAIDPLMAAIMMTSIHYRSICDTPAVFSPTMVAWARRASENAIIMTDDLWTTSLRHFILPDAAVHPSRYPDSAFAHLVTCAVRAGNDMLMITYPQKVPLIIRAIMTMAKDDASVAGHVDSAVRRILQAKQRIGLIGNVSGRN